MEFKLNEDQQMIHDLAKDFAESVLQPRIDEIEAGEMTEVSNGSILSCPTTFTSSWLSAASSASASPRSTTASAWATWSRPS